MNRASGRRSFGHGSSRPSFRPAFRRARRAARRGGRNARSTSSSPTSSSSAATSRSAREPSSSRKRAASSSGCAMRATKCSACPATTTCRFTTCCAASCRRSTRYRRFIDETLCPFVELPGIAVLGINTARSLTFKDGRISQDQVAFIRETFARTPTRCVAHPRHASSACSRFQVGEEIDARRSAGRSWRWTRSRRRASTCCSRATTTTRRVTARATSSLARAARSSSRRARRRRPGCATRSRASTRSTSTTASVTMTVECLGRATGFAAARRAAIRVGRGPLAHRADREPRTELAAALAATRARGMPLPDRFRSRRFRHAAFSPRISGRAAT